MNNQNHILGPRWRNRTAEAEQAEEPVVVVIDKRELRIFIIRVYVCAGTLCLLSAIPWICVSALQAEVYQSIPVPAFVWLILGFILLTVLSCIPQTPVTVWLCWGLVIGSLFFTTLALCYYVAVLPWYLVVASLVVSLVLQAQLNVFGAFAPKVLLPNLLCNCCVVLLGCITLFALLLVGLFTRDTRFILASAVVFFVILIFLALFHASYICGRWQHLPYGEIASCANGVYMHFWLMAVCVMIFGHFIIYGVEG